MDHSRNQEVILLGSSADLCRAIEREMLQQNFKGPSFPRHSQTPEDVFAGHKRSVVLTPGDVDLDRPPVEDLSHTAARQSFPDDAHPDVFNEIAFNFAAISEDISTQPPASLSGPITTIKGILGPLLVDHIDFVSIFTGTYWETLWYTSWGASWVTVDDTQSRSFSPPPHLSCLQSLPNSIPNTRLYYHPLPLYQSLDQSAAEIRVLNIHSGDEHDAIHCTLMTTSFLDSQITYEALSYAKGGPPVMKSIYVNGNPFNVTVGLESILRHLPLRRLERTIWIDLLCIDPYDPEECTSQFHMLAAIYQLTKKVLVWWLSDEDWSTGWGFFFEDSILTPNTLPFPAKEETQTEITYSYQKQLKSYGLNENAEHSSWDLETIWNSPATHISRNTPEANALGKCWLITLDELGDACSYITGIHGNGIFLKGWNKEWGSHQRPRGFGFIHCGWYSDHAGTDQLFDRDHVWAVTQTMVSFANFALWTAPFRSIYKVYPGFWGRFAKF